MKNRKLLNEYYSNWNDALLLNEQQVPGGPGNYGNVWEFCGVTPGPQGQLGATAFSIGLNAGTVQYGDIADVDYGVNGYYLGIPNYWVPEKCNDQLCTQADVGNEFEVIIKPNHYQAATYHLRLVSVGQSTPTVTNVCNYGSNPPATNIYNCPHYYNNFVDGNCLPSPEYGCTDPTATNYLPTATMDDGSCVYPIPGCTDPAANNYNPNATVDDGSCTFTDICHGELSWMICDQGNSGYPPGSGPVWSSMGPGTVAPTPDGCFQCDGQMCTAADIGQPFQLPNYTGGVPTTAVGLLDSIALPKYMQPQDIYNAQAAVCPPPQGCTNPLATNYDPLAVVDDGSCIIPGCTDVNANNYLPSATIDDGSCTYDVLGCTDSTATNYDPLATVDDGSCYWEGCTDPTATNYDPNATVDDGSCIIPGCTDPAATNYNPNATIDDGSCVFPTVGCTDPTASNYNPVATVDDGSCYWLGCTDPAATNYDPNATQDDGSCIYPVYGCTDPAATNYNSLATVDDGSCVYPIPGCTDPLAFNYDPNATVDDGSCLYDGCTDINATNFNPNANADCSGVPGGPDTSCCIYPVPGCPDPTVVGPIVNTGTQFCVNGCEVYDPLAIGCPDNNGLVVPGDTSCCCFLGCTDVNATNYDPLACIDDNSCQLPPPINCSCCEVGQPGTISQPVGIMINGWTPGGCASLNSATLTNCDTAQAFDPTDCEPDCTTFDFSSATNLPNSLGSTYTMLNDAYNMGLQNSQAYGIMDGNSTFCYEFCVAGGGTHWACDCCGDIHDCDQDTYWPKPYGCWTCRDDNTCGQPSPSWMSSNMTLNYYNNQADCLADAPVNCPPKPSCDNTPEFCSQTPSLTPGGSCWICHHQTVCLPVYDYLEYGSGPPGSTGTYSFMMNWLIPQGTNPQTYKTPQGSDLFCNAQDCVANSPCTEWDTWKAEDCGPPPGGCPPNEIWYPYPKCECGLPKVIDPVDKKRPKDKEKEKELDVEKTDSDRENKETIKEEFSRMKTIWNYKL
tara:strand:+ start:1046 stop:4081 length:3036 start_codon:yes stop_codon:yes gene_type:complete